MITVSTATATTREDNHEAELNGTISDAVNNGWTAQFNRAGVYDLKAPDSQLFGSHFRFLNLSPTVLPRSVIQAASFTGGAFPPNGLGGTKSPLNLVIEIVAPDGLWDAEPETAADWRTVKNSTYQFNAEVNLFDGGASLLVGSGVTGGVLAGTLPIRAWGGVSPFVERINKAGNVSRCTAAGTIITGSVRMHKVGAPPGSVFLEVWNVGVDGKPSTWLCTSDSRLSTSLSVSNNPDVLESFTFSGANQKPVILGNDYAIVVNRTGAFDFANYINVRFAYGAVANNHAVSYGEGRGCCFGNYLSTHDLLDLPVVSGSGSVPWVISSSWTENAPITTPDLSSLIQAFVNSPSYAAGDPFLLRIKRLSGAQLAHRGFKSFQNADTPGLAQYPTLSITHRRRRTGII